MRPEREPVEPRADVAKRRLLLLFAFGVLANWPWEWLQFRFYRHPGGRFAIWSHTIFAALADGALVLVLYMIGWLMTRADRWYVNARPRVYAMVALTAVALATGSEAAALYVFERWSYTSAMPTMPLLGIGLVPLLQALVMPPIVFIITDSVQKR